VLRTVNKLSVVSDASILLFNFSLYVPLPDQLASARGVAVAGPLQQPPAQLAVPFHIDLPGVGRPNRDIRG